MTKNNWFKRSRKLLWHTYILAAICGLSLPISLAASVQGASYDCDQGGLNETEQTICDLHVLAFLDGELSELYRPINQHLISAQRDWLARRNQCGKDEVCIFTAYADRINALESEHGYPVTNLNKSLIVRDPRLGFVLGKDDMYAISFHSFPACEKERFSLNKDQDEVVLCSAGCSSYSCPIEYFVRRGDVWLSLDIGLSDRVKISISDSVPEALLEEYELENGMINEWTPVQTEYVGPGIPSTCKQVTYYFYVNGKYRSVFTELLPWGKGNPVCE